MSAALIDIIGLSSDERRAREKAKALLAECKERESQEEMVTIRVDRQTVKRMPRSKAIKLGLINP